jgi:hypothetical protein
MQPQRGNLTIAACTLCARRLAGGWRAICDLW